jgi:hypothetical protein
MDLPGIHFNMSSERIIIEHNVFETVGSWFSGFPKDVFDLLIPSGRVRA